MDVTIVMSTPGVDGLSEAVGVLREWWGDGAPMQLHPVDLCSADRRVPQASAVTCRPSWTTCHAGRTVRDRPSARPGPAALTSATALAARLGAAGPPPRRPDGRARLAGSLHSASRDRAAISHHYDLSDDFYALLLDESMDTSLLDKAPGNRTLYALRTVYLGQAALVWLISLPCTSTPETMWRAGPLDAAMFIPVRR
ncbi:hypothetical protein ACLGI4_00320 [Streptomyces sp. HMX112]|uniref:hypothetical protein n=1 Tax=Streptomyces sp. HMX112 TaxID=3390850 RepID=UPI003A80089D